MSGKPRNKRISNARIRKQQHLLEVNVRAPGDVLLVAQPFVVQATKGEEIRIDPLRHVRGASGELRLAAVPAKPDATLTADFDGGSFRFTSSAVRTHFLEYSVTDGPRVKIIR